MDIAQLLTQINPILILSVVGGLAVFLLIIGVVVSITVDRRAAEMNRLGKYIEDEELLSERDRARPLVDWLNNRVERSTLGERISNSLSRADLKFKPGEFVFFTIISSVLVGFVLWYVGGKNIVVLLIGAAVGLYLPNLYVKSQQSKRLIKFDQQLPDMLNLMVNGLRAGYSNMQAMEAVSRELPPPISDEFRRVVQEMQLGVSLDTALDNLTRRIPSRDLELVVTATNVQREVGGNLAEILDTISHTIRERIRIKGEIRVLTSQVMISGRFLALMPVILIIAMYFLNNEYMMRFFNEETKMFGVPALIGGALMIIIGYFTMTRIASIEV